MEFFLADARSRGEHPKYLSRAAYAGVLIIIGLSICMGVEYWWRTDPLLAVLTLGCEAIAACGLPIAAWCWRRRKLVNALLALSITLLAASWSALTMFEKIQADTRAAALTAAQEQPAYIFAESAARTASGLLRDRLASPNPRPQCTCPQTIAAWEASEAAQIDRLRAERDAALADMEAATPEPHLDRIALLRGIGMEIIKLTGLLAFGLGAPSAVGAAPAHNPRQPRQPPTPPNAAPAQPADDRRCVSNRSQQPVEIIAQPKQVRPARLGAQLLASVVAGLGAAHEPQPLAAATTSAAATTWPRQPGAQPAPSDVHLAHLARALSPGIGERRIAARLSALAGEHITRHQVRIWLGRERRERARPASPPF